MTIINPTLRPTTPQLNITIEVQYLEKAISWFIQSGINFAVYPTEPRVVPTLERDTNYAPQPVVQKHSSNDSIVSKRHDTLENSFESMDALIDEYIQKAIIPDMEVVARRFEMSLSSFKLRFKDTYGKTFYQAYMDKRMEHAAVLLKQGYKAVQVSKRIGYGEKSCIKFNKMFQKHFGMTPKKYQMSQK